MRNILREERTKNGLTQIQLADLVGVSRQSIIAIETKKYTPTIILALKLAKALNKKVEELFFLENDD
ncbi:MAG TPA: helix-turn-helix transcriptional regulator [Niabella sp.]|jgi:putative transcriptional regulator|nr:helix-turn-helix transcriptional regulator [Chitinophagaceae bacterium]HRN47638.1 helix-turn-helix transcriptional regulator [Niabella sp.]HRO84319.1 helix-turn-helix transcriptional regulator [Niabella sp.]HUN04085.1 helix-turn-helix transcriptional regulator [Niabella sp.]